MAIYQDLEGDKAGGRLPYMQSPVGAQPDKTAEQKLQGAQSVKQLGFRIAGLALDASRMRENQIERKEKEEYEKRVANQHEEIARRVHWNRSNSHIVSQKISEAKKELIEFKSTLHGKDASVQWYEKVKEVADRFNFKELEDVPDELMDLIDVNVSPDPVTATNIAKGLVEEADVLKGHQLRAFNDIYSSIIKYGQANEASLLDTEIKAAQREKREALTTRLADITQIGVEETANPVEKINKLVIDVEELFSDLKGMHGDVPELLAQDATGLAPQFGAAFSGVGDSLKLSVANSLTAGTHWVSTDLEQASKNIEADLTAINLQLNNVEQIYEDIALDTNNPKVLEAWQNERQKIETNIAKDLQRGIRAMSANLPPLLVEQFGGELSPDTRQELKEGGSFGDFLVRDSRFKNSIEKSLPKAEYDGFLTGYPKGENTRPPTGGGAPNINTMSNGNAEAPDPTTTTVPSAVPEVTDDGEIGGDSQKKETPLPEEPSTDLPNESNPFFPAETVPSVPSPALETLKKKLSKAPKDVAEGTIEGYKKAFETDYEGIRDENRRWVMKSNENIEQWASHPDFPMEILEYSDPGPIGTSLQKRWYRIKFLDKNTGKKGSMRLDHAINEWGKPKWAWINNE